MYHPLKRMLSPGPLFAAILFAAGPAVSGAAMITTNPGTPVNLPGISTFVTHGDDMDGLQITATFDSGFVETATLFGTGFQAGSAMGTNWSVDVSGDTFFSNAWAFNNNTTDALTQLEFFGGPGLAVFDLSTPDVSLPTSTPNTALGTDFRTDLDPMIDDLIRVIYSDEVSVGANAAVGDIYERVTVFFRNPNGGPLLDQTVGFNFSMDTDSDIRAFLPEPGSALLLASALVLGAVGRRRRR